MDYSKFKIMECNRAIDYKHVEEFKKLFAEVGYFQAFPVMVDKDFNIIDGQHRFLACKDMGIEFPFVVQENATPEMIISINTTQKKWGIDDYVNHYAARGIGDFGQLKSFAETYSVSVGCALAILDNSIGGGSKQVYLKQGLFKLRDGQLMLARVRADKIMSTVHSMRMKPTERLVRSLILANQDSNFNFDKFISKVSRQFDKVQQCSTTTGWLMMIERIYNNKNADKISLLK